MLLPLMFTAADPSRVYQRGCTSIWSRDLCPQKLKLFCRTKILNGLDHTAFIVDCIDQELYRDIKVTIMLADRPEEWHRMHFICNISLAGNETVDVR